MVAIRNNSKPVLHFISSKQTPSSPPPPSHPFPVSGFPLIDSHILSSSSIMLNCSPSVRVHSRSTPLSLSSTFPLSHSTSLSLSCSLATNHTLSSLCSTNSSTAHHGLFHLNAKPSHKVSPIVRNISSCPSCLAS